MYPGTYVVYVCDMLFTLLSLDRVRILAVYGGVGGVRELSEFIKYILIFFSEALTKVLRVWNNMRVSDDRIFILIVNPKMKICWAHTLTGHFIRYTLLVPGWTPFYLHKCLNSWWYRFNKVLETFLRDFGPYWHDSITQLLQIYDVNLPFHHIPKVLYWIEIWWLWRPFE